MPIPLFIFKMTNNCSLTVMTCLFVSPHCPLSIICDNSISLIFQFALFFCAYTHDTPHVDEKYLVGKKFFLDEFGHCYWGWEVL